MIKYNYYGINLAEDQEPTDPQIRELMRILELDYYSAQEELRCITYGEPPEAFETWAQYLYQK